MDAISFGTDGWRATLDTFTSERVRVVAQAAADYLDGEGRMDETLDSEGRSREALDSEGQAGATVAVGYDARETSRGFAEDAAEVFARNGFDVLLPERDCPTPLVAHAIVDRDLAGALVITASHNPPEYNGVKFIPEDGAPALPEVTEAIEANLREPVDAEPTGEVRDVDFVESHAEHCLDLVDADLSGLTVVYDAMHGSGRGVTDALLERAGAEVICERCERDPEFGGTPPEPDAANLQGLAAAVREHDADFGVANDGDADRVAVVTPDRGVLDGNRFYALAYDYLLEGDSGPAIRTVSTTFLVDRLAEAHGCDVVETPVGFKWVADAMREHDALFGGEESGGYTMRGHVREKDGVLMALVAAAAASERDLDDRLDAITDDFGDIHQNKVSLDCPDDRKQRVLDDLTDRLPDQVAGVDVERVNDADGFKILLADGTWLLVRPSGTEPKLRVYAEADSEARVEELLDAGRDLVAPLV